jgi:serine/threonine-protein phosphatase 2B regulatory subunit
MIRMVDKNGDGQVSFEEFYKMVTDGKAAPPGLFQGQRRPQGQSQGSNVTGSPNIVQGPETIEIRNKKRKLLEEFTKDQSLKPESITKAHRRFLSTDRSKSGVVDYIEFCDMLQVKSCAQCQEVFASFDYRKDGLVDAKEVLIALANFTGASKDDKCVFFHVVIMILLK